MPLSFFPLICFFGLFFEDDGLRLLDLGSFPMLSEFLLFVFTYSYDGFKRILGTKLHVAVEKTGLPVSIVCSPANVHDSTKFIDVLENISDFLDDDALAKTVSVYADKGYDAAYIRDYLKCHGIGYSIPYKKNSKSITPKNRKNNYNKTRYVVERFFAWLKCGFRRTAIRYERNCENYLGLVYLASIIMYWRVIG